MSFDGNVTVGGLNIDGMNTTTGGPDSASPRSTANLDLGGGNSAHRHQHHQQQQLNGSNHRHARCPRLLLKVLSHDEGGKEIVILFDTEYGTHPGVLNNSTLAASSIIASPTSHQYHHPRSVALVDRVSSVVGAGSRRTSAAAAMLGGVRPHLTLPAASAVTVSEMQRALSAASASGVGVGVGGLGATPAAATPFRGAVVASPPRQQRAASNNNNNNHNTTPAPSADNNSITRSAMSPQATTPGADNANSEQLINGGGGGSSPFSAIPVERQLLRFEGRTIVEPTRTGGSGAGSAVTARRTVAEALSIFDTAASSLVHRTIHLYDAGLMHLKDNSASLEIGAVLAAPRWVPPVFEQLPSQPQFASASTQQAQQQLPPPPQAHSSSYNNSNDNVTKSSSSSSPHHHRLAQHDHDGSSGRHQLPQEQQQQQQQQRTTVVLPLSPPRNPDPAAVKIHQDAIADVARAEDRLLASVEAVAEQLGPAASVGALVDPAARSSDVTRSMLLLERAKVEAERRMTEHMTRMRMEEHQDAVQRLREAEATILALQQQQHQAPSSSSAAAAAARAASSSSQHHHGAATSTSGLRPTPISPPQQQVAVAAVDTASARTSHVRTSPDRANAASTTVSQISTTMEGLQSVTRSPPIMPTSAGASSSSIVLASRRIIAAPSMPSEILLDAAPSVPMGGRPQQPPPQSRPALLPPVPVYPGAAVSASNSRTPSPAAAMQQQQHHRAVAGARHIPAPSMSQPTMWHGQHYGGASAAASSSSSHRASPAAPEPILMSRFYSPGPASRHSSQHVDRLAQAVRESLGR